MRKRDLIRLSSVIILTLCFFGGTGCATRMVAGPNGGIVTVYPMHETSVQPTMAEVARLQRAGDGFLLMYVDGEMAPVADVDYIEVIPGSRKLILAPGSEGMFSFEMTEQVYTLWLNTKPGAWYIFRTRILEEGTTTEPVVRGTMKETKRQVTLAPFEVIEIHNGAYRTVATTRDFRPL
jgi:hypothetical protein